MNTDRIITPNCTITGSKSAPSVAHDPIPATPPVPFEAKPIPTLVKVMQSVKTDTPEAELNKTTISDGKGGRITMDDHMLTKTFKGVEPRKGFFRGVEDN